MNDRVTHQDYHPQDTPGYLSAAIDRIRTEHGMSNEIPSWVDFIQIQKTLAGTWEARLIGSRKTHSWHELSDTTARDSIAGKGATPEQAIAEALTTPGAYETHYNRDRWKDGGR